ncbi:DegV family protein [Carnobacteriaceae bacterium 52-44]
MDWKIVTDTGSNIREINNLPENVAFDIIPLILHIDNEDYIDTPDLDTEILNQKVAEASKSSSACPAPGVYAEKFAGAENVICFTISSELSGSYNSADQGKQLALEENPDANIYIFDTRSAGGEMDLLVFKAIELVKEGMNFHEVVDELNKYHEKTYVGYMLKSIENLVKNGRVNKVVGSLVGLLNIHVIGIRSEEGTIEMSNRARGEKRALNTFINDIIEAGFSGKVMEIGHVNNETLAKKFSEKILEKFPQTDIRIRPTSGLCSFYAERGGLIVGYERV